MNTIQRIAKNTAALMAAQFIGYLLSFFYMMYTARYLGPSNYGILSFAMAFTAIFGIFTDLGLQPLTIREVARDKTSAGKYLANISTMKILLVVIVMGLIALTVNLLGYPEQTVHVVYIIGLSVIITTFTQMFYSIFRAYEGMEYESLGRILNSALLLTGVLLAINNDFTVTGFAFIFLSISIIQLIYSFIISRYKTFDPPLKWSPLKLEIDRVFWKRTILKALPFGLSIIFSTIFTWTDTVMLSIIKDDAVVGLYNCAYRMVLVLAFIPQTISNAIMPVMAKLYLESHEALKLTYEKTFKFLAIIALPIGVGTTILSQKFILLVFGVDYTDSIPALQILVWSSVFIFLNYPIVILLISIDKQTITAKITCVCAFLNIILNFILIPKYSLNGASITTVFTEFLSLSLNYIWVQKYGYGIYFSKLLRLFIKVFVASALMGLFIIFFKDMNLILLILLSMLVYFFILTIFRIIDQEDINLMKNIIKK